MRDERSFLVELGQSLMLEDKLLIHRLKRGDEDALRRLYEKYKDDLRTIAGSLLHDTNAAEDVLHDVFVSFAESIGQLQLKVSLRSYLAACVVNKVRDEFRRRQSHTIELDKAGPIGSDSERPDKSAVAGETSRLLTDALALIPFDQREVIVLRLKAEMKFKEIARMQNTSLSTVQGRYRYGLEKLRTILDGVLEI
ncbi:MAG: RNA polymerase sigma factor [Planctomycetota bacterium]|jgi:RNA polymerase sigma-70 factor (ECF subfamily)